MILLLLCIIVNAFIGVIFKYFERFEVDVFPAIVANYFVCALTGSIFLGEIPFDSSTLSQSWFPYALLLSGTFIGTFVLMALTVQGFGIVVATIFQKMSLLAPAIIGIIAYQEPVGWLKVVGILIAIVSIFAITKTDQNEAEKNQYSKWIFPVVVFFGSCIIDTLLYYINVNNIVDSGDIRFVITLFFLAGIIGLFFLIFKIIRGQARINQKSIIAGISLGVPNFFSIYLLVLVLSKGMDGSVVFPINNVGILAFSAIFGLILFNEKLGKVKSAGLLMAIAAIMMIAYG